VEEPSGYAGVMPRKHRRRPEGTGIDEERARRGVERVQVSADGAWLVRHITVDGAIKTYRCPGCDQEIGPHVAHIVAWPADERGDLTDRRHWHTGCWQARGRRGPARRW
jgi:hypothetical protein